ncbi:hypothetical protein L210DRAFT_791494, partial [Boletus edulis BED1]
LNHEDCPLYLHHVSSSMVPLYYHAVPEDVPEVYMIRPDHHIPFYISINSNGDLTVACNIQNPDLITIVV